MSNEAVRQIRRRPRHTASGAPESFDPESSFDMANLFPRNTGLPRAVYVSPRNAPHDVRVKVCLVPGDRMLADQTASVALPPDIHEVSDPPLLPSDVMAAVTAWARLNRDVLIAYWDGGIDTMELMQRLRRI
jgi:hypothetical protein